MKSIFEDQNEWAKFKAILTSWLGTPYRHLQHAKGYGADCTLFIGAALVEGGFMEKLSYDFYPKDWNIHTNEELVLDSSHRHFAENMAPGYFVKEFKPGEYDLQRGDMVAMKTMFSKVTNHAAIIWDDEENMINAVGRQGVCFMQYKPWIKKITTVFRFCVNEGE